MIKAFFLTILLMLSGTLHSEETKDTAASKEENVADPKLTPQQIRFQQEIRWEKMKKESLEDGKRGALDKKGPQVLQVPNRMSFRHSGFINFSPFDLWIPYKYGLSYGYNYSKTTTFEIEYLTQSLKSPIIFDDLGHITDSRLSLLARKFKKESSFNTFYGLNLSTLTAKLGPAYLSTISANPSAYDIVKIQTLGITYGLGNRWTMYDKYNLSIDWITLNLPLITTKSELGFLSNSNSENRKDDVEKVVRIFRKLPSFAALKVQIGMSF